MVELLYPQLRESLAGEGFFASEEPPPFEWQMPRVFRRPRLPVSLTRKNRPSFSVHRLLAFGANSAGPQRFGELYGQLASEYQPAIQWALSCWEFLLSIQGCRFVPRCAAEKMYCRGDYRVFTEADFHRLVYQTFKEVAFGFLREGRSFTFEAYLKQTFWPAIVEKYRALERPADPRQRNLTAYSYLRCVPYRFLNSFHEGHVQRIVRRLPQQERQILELYYLHFYTEEAVQETFRISPWALRRRRAAGLRAVAQQDYLSYILLTQLERY